MDTLHDKMSSAIAKTGIWSGKQRQSHAFQFCPHSFELDAAQRAELDRLAVAIDDCLNGISRIVAISEQPDLCSSQSIYQRVGRVLKPGSPHKLPATRPKNLPILRKCDILVDADGHFWLAEVDATNPRSWGYSILGRQLSACQHPDQATLPGVAPLIADELKHRGTTEVTFLYGDTQRFYRPEFEIITRELRAHGIAMQAVNETEVQVLDDQLMRRTTREPLSHTLVDLPPMNHNGQLIKWLKAATLSGEVQYLIPPKYFLAAKTLLGLLSNPTGEEALEALLHSQISKSSLATVRAHLPQTWIVGRDWPEPPRPNGTGLILKRSISSGMKNIFFSTEAGFAEALAEALTDKHGSNILQTEIQNRAFAWQVFGDDGQLIPAQDRYLRLTAYMSRQAVEDIAVTACTTKRVHGGKTAIITGTILV